MPRADGPIAPANKTNDFSRLCLNQQHETIQMNRHRRSVVAIRGCFGGGVPSDLTQSADIRTEMRKAFEWPRALV
jgi:hypothetical protein